MACHTSRALAVSGGWVAVEGAWRSALAAKITTRSSPVIAASTAST